MKVTLSRATKLWAFYIWTSAYYMRQLLEFVVRNLGHNIAFIGVSVALILCAFYVGTAFNRIPDWKRKIAGALIIIVVIIFSLTLDLPEERAHLVIYGVMGWLLAKDFQTLKFPHNIGVAMILTFAVGSIDEGIQYFIPWRVCDIRDVGFDCIGGFAAVALCICSLTKTSDDHRDQRIQTLL